MATSTKPEMVARDLDHLIHPLHNRKTHASAAHVWVKGEGAILFDADGKEYIDGLAGLWNVVAGHGRKELAAAAATQMETLAYCSAYAGSSNPPAIELATKLAEMCYPSINRFFFTSGGGESTETSIKTGALLLEDARARAQDQGHLARMGLSRRDARRHERHRHQELLADVRAARARVRA